MQTQIRLCRGIFFLKINKRAGQIPIQMQENKRAGGFFFLKNNKHADLNKAVQGGIFFLQTINVHARLFGTLEYFKMYKQIKQAFINALTE